MLGLLMAFLFVGSIAGFMYLAYLRMIAIRDGTQSRLETDPEQIPVETPYVDEVRSENGMSFAKPMVFDHRLSSADKRANELPDVNQTLQGKR